MTRSLLLLLAVFQLSVTAQTLDTTAVYKVRKEMVALLKANKLAEIAAFYATDAQMIGFDGSRKGIEEIKDYWNAIQGEGVQWTWKTIEWGGSKDVVYQRGITTLLLRYDDFEKEYTSQFLVIWKHTDKGYKILYDFYKKM